MFNKTLFFVLFLCATTICHCENENVTEADSSTSTVLTTVSSTVKPDNFSCTSYNGQCKECIQNKKCYYCQTNQKCNLYPISEIIPTDECSVDDTRYLTCLFSFKVLMILIGTLGGIVLLTILCVCCYCCCKKKGTKLSKDEVKFARQREERKARAEERKKERASRTDEIRRKYGLMRDDNPYERFDA